MADRPCCFPASEVKDAEQSKQPPASEVPGHTAYLQVLTSGCTQHFIVMYEPPVAADQINDVVTSIKMKPKGG